VFCPGEPSNEPFPNSAWVWARGDRAPVGELWRTVPADSGASFFWLSTGGTGEAKERALGMGGGVKWGNGLEAIGLGSSVDSFTVATLPRRTVDAGSLVLRFLDFGSAFARTVLLSTGSLLVERGRPLFFVGFSVGPGSVSATGGADSDDGVEGWEPGASSRGSVPESHFWSLLADARSLKRLTARVDSSFSFVGFNLAERSYCASYVGDSTCSIFLREIVFPASTLHRSRRAVTAGFLDITAPPQRFVFLEV